MIIAITFRFGPLRHQWCMRHESKNAQIKRFVWARSYKNVPLSVATHHQLWMCHQLATRPGQTSTNYLYGGDQVASGKEVTHWHSAHTLYVHHALVISIMHNYYRNTLWPHLAQRCTPTTVWWSRLASDCPMYVYRYMWRTYLQTGTCTSCWIDLSVMSVILT